MKTKILKSLSLLGLSLMTALSVAAQDQSKVKANDNEYKYKSEDSKVKLTEDEAKFKSDERKVKVTEDEVKYKSDDLKIKETDDERKVKATVTPMRPTTTQRTEMKAGETRVMTKEHLAPISTDVAQPDVPAPVVGSELAVPKTAATVAKPASPKRVAPKSAARPHTAARKTSTAPKTIVRTKVVRDTVYVPSPPETVVATRTEYVRDTVMISRVDTVVKVETKNTYAGYPVPAGDFKKVKLKQDKDGEVRMKRKE